MTGLNLSFSMKRATWKSALFVILLVTTGVLAPLLYFSWWGLRGGREREIRHRLEHLVGQDPRGEARAALEEGDYRLYVVGAPLETEIPGFGWADEPYKNTFGYRGVALLEGPRLSREEAALNAAAIRHMTTYNQIVYAEANRRYPDWLADYRVRNRPPGR